VTQRVETRKSVVDPNNNRTSTSNYDNKGNLISKEETGYILINGVPTLKTYKTEHQYNALVNSSRSMAQGQMSQISPPRNIMTTVLQRETIRGNFKAIVNALGQRTEFSDYDANGNVGRLFDFNGVVTSENL